MIKIFAEQTNNYTFLYFPLLNGESTIEIQIETKTGKFCNLSYNKYRSNNAQPATISIDASPEQERHSQDGSIPDGE